MATSTKNFNVNEFACKCGCGYNVIDQKVINLCQKIRDKLGMAIHINSGCRCEKHNAKIGGVKNSYHVQGKAADLSCSYGAARLFEIITDMKARGEISELEYGIYYVKKNFVHVDIGKVRSKFFEINLKG